MRSQRHAEHVLGERVSSRFRLATTGATVLTGLDNLPKAFLFYRQLLQWLGGMGIIVLAVAVLPLLGIGVCGSIAPDPGAVQGQQGDPRISPGSQRRSGSSICC